jgi:hypothetical protein
MTSSQMAASRFSRKIRKIASLGWWAVVQRIHAVAITASVESRVCGILANLRRVVGMAVADRQISSLAVGARRCVVIAVQRVGRIALRAVAYHRRRVKRVRRRWSAVCVAAG